MHGRRLLFSGLFAPLFPFDTLCAACVSLPCLQHFPPKELTVDLDKLEDVTLHAIQGYISSVKRVFEL